MNRRAFLGGLIASATMAEAGALAEFLDWLRRKPTTTIGTLGKDLFVPIRFQSSFLDAAPYRMGVVGRCYGFDWYYEPEK